MALIAAMRQQDVAPAAVYRAQIIIPSVADPVPVAQSIWSCCIPENRLLPAFLFSKYRHVVRLQPAEVIRLFPEITAIAGKKDLCV